MEIVFYISTLHHSHYQGNFDLETLCMARVYHQGQPEQSIIGVITCSKCLENGYHVSKCNNVVKCRMCMQSGHVKGSCPNASHHQATDRENQRSDTNSLTQESYSDKVRKQTNLKDFLPATKATSTTSSSSNTSNKSRCVDSCIRREKCHCR